MRKDTWGISFILPVNWSTKNRIHSGHLKEKMRLDLRFALLLDQEAVEKHLPCATFSSTKHLQYLNSRKKVKAGRNTKCNPLSHPNVTRVKTQDTRNTHKETQTQTRKWATRWTLGGQTLLFWRRRKLKLKATATPSWAIILVNGRVIWTCVLVLSPSFNVYTM